MAQKPMFRVLSSENHPALKVYEIVMPDGIKFRYAYGQMKRINEPPLTRIREIKDNKNVYAAQG